MYLPRILLFIILAMILTTISKIGSDPRILLMVIDLISGIIVILLLNALIADITDIDEKNAECRREAIYFGTQGLITKSIAGLAEVFSSILFENLEYSIGSDLGIRTTFILSGIILILAIIVFLRYLLEH